MFVEDEHKEELHYIDFLCDVHSDLLDKYENMDDD
jgi:hypothetical protein